MCIASAIVHEAVIYCYFLYVNIFIKRAIKKKVSLKNFHSNLFKQSGKAVFKANFEHMMACQWQ